MNKRFSFSRRSKWVAVLIAGLLVLQRRGCGAGSGGNIDTFRYGTQDLYRNSSTSITNSGVGTDVAALGGDREVVVTHGAGCNGHCAQCHYCVWLQTPIGLTSHKEAYCYRYPCCPLGWHQSDPATD